MELGKYIEHLQIQNSVADVQVSNLRVSVSKELKQFLVSGFTTEEVEVVEFANREYAIVTSAENRKFGLPSVVVLKRNKSELGSLGEQVSSGVVTGLASSRQFISKKRLNQLGFDLPDSSPETLLYVDVDREYLSVIIGVTAAYIVFGLIGLFFVYQKLDDMRAEKRNHRANVNAQVALQLAITRQETYKY